jgi:hypothetical protein
METDSKLVQLAFKSLAIIPWQLSNRWQNCLTLTRSMNFFVTHIFREGNTCADALANLGLNTDTFIWWDLPPLHIAPDFYYNKLGYPNYRYM